VTSVTKVSFVFVVIKELNLKLAVKNKYIKSGSTTTGVIDATVYGANEETKLVFSSVVRLVPRLFLTDIKTFPYSGVSTTPRLESKDPFSPPNTWIAVACG
jgi:hypothetical protein